MGKPDVRSIIALLLIAAFIGAYFLHPSAMLEGAMIGAFSTAVGYYLGSSKGSAEAGSKLREIAGSATGTGCDP